MQLIYSALYEHGERGNGERGNGEWENGERHNGERHNGERGNGERGNGERHNAQRWNGEPQNKNAEVLLRLEAHLQVCEKYRQEIKHIQQYLPNWQPRFDR